MPAQVKARPGLRTSLDLTAMSFVHMVNDSYLTFAFPVLPKIVQAFSLSPVQAGMVVSAFRITGSAFQLPFSFLADLSGRRKLILGSGLALSGLALVFLGFVPSYPLFLVGMALAGLGGAAYHPQISAIVADRFKDIKGLAFGVHGLGGNIGASLSPALVGIAIMHLGWREALPLFGLPGLAAALLVMALFTERANAVRSLTGSLSTFKQDVMLNPSLLLLVGVSAFRTAGEFGLATFVPLLAAQKLGMDAATIGFLISLFYGVGAAIQPVAGYLSDRFGHQRVMFAVLFGAGLFTATVSLATSPWKLFLVMAIVGILSFAVRPLVLALATDLVDARVISSSVGLIFTFNQISGAISPIIGGFIIELAGYQYSFPLFALFFVAASLCAAFVRKKAGDSSSLPGADSSGPARPQSGQG